MASESTIHENTPVEFKKKNKKILPHFTQMMNVKAEPFLQAWTLWAKEGCSCRLQPWNLWLWKMTVVSFCININDA